MGSVVTISGRGEMQILIPVLTKEALKIYYILFIKSKLT
jgi:hypothetical protein